MFWFNNKNIHLFPRIILPLPSKLQFIFWSSAVNVFIDIHNELDLVVLEVVTEEHWMCLKTQNFKENFGKSSNMKLKYKFHSKTVAM